MSQYTLLKRKMDEIPSKHRLDQIRQILTPTSFFLLNRIWHSDCAILREDLSRDIGPPSNVDEHLTKLKQLDLIANCKEGRRVRYLISPKMNSTIFHVLEWLFEPEEKQASGV